MKRKEAVIVLCFAIMFLTLNSMFVLFDGRIGRIISGGIIGGVSIIIAYPIGVSINKTVDRFFPNIDKKTSDFFTKFYTIESEEKKKEEK